MSATAIPLGREGTGGASGPISPTDCLTITDFVRARSGIVLGPDKAYLVESRLEQIVRKRRYSGLAELVAHVRTGQNDKLADEIIEAITTNETLFFRDIKPFEHLQQHLPVLDCIHPPTRPLRIWSAAASSGQECYSIAMTALEAGLGARPVQILGTDISGEQINRARQGLYSDFEVQRGMSAQKLARYFAKTDMGWKVTDAVRKLVEFRKWNLLDDTRPLGKFDLVFCRNVLIYFDVRTKKKVLDTIWEHLLPGGLLYLGGAETTFGVSDRFVPYGGAYQVYEAVP